MPSTKTRISARPAVYLRYGVLCLLELLVVVLVLALVQQWVAAPRRLLWILVAAWVVKDVALFPFVWPAYDPDAPSRIGDMVGARGVAKERLDPSGYVQVRAELWRAVIADDSPPIEAGCRVRVLHREGLTLFVAPDGKGVAQ